MTNLACPYLSEEVELTEERRQHIFKKHPDLLPDHFDQLARVLADPDEIRKDARFANTQLFSRWFDDLKEGKFVVVAVVTDTQPQRRHWIVTAYIARRLVQGDVVWTRN